MQGDKYSEPSEEDSMWFDCQKLFLAIIIKDNYHLTKSGYVLSEVSCAHIVNSLNALKFNS